MPSSALVSRKEKKSIEKTPDVRLYSSLRKQVTQVLEEGRRRAQEAVEQEKAATYWQVGRLIDRHVLEQGERGDYGKQVLKRLAGDLNTNQTLLYYAVQFARSYPIFPAPGKLTWSHYRALLPVKDENVRRKLEEQAEAWGWSSRRLENALQSAGKNKTSPFKSREASGALSPRKPGEPYIYQLRRSQAPGANPESLLVDLGFSTYRELDMRPKNYFAGDLLRSRKKAGNGAYEWIRLGQSSPANLYHYRAWCERVVDGDTVWMQIDLGFGVWTRQKLRLRGLNTPELKTAEGEKSRRFLEAHLRKPEGVLIHTKRSDKYDRYLADIFTGGEHLNYLLLKNSLAVPA